MPSILKAALTLAPEPTAQPSNFLRTAVSTTGFSIQWTAAPATDGYLVLRTVSASAVFPNTDPTDGVAYSVGTTLGNAVVAYSGPDLTVALSALNANERHNIKIFSFNGSGISTNYLTINPLQGSAYTLTAEPTAHATTFSATLTNAPGLSLSFSAANTLPASGYLILRKESPFVSTDYPNDGQAYLVGATVGAATVSHVVTNAAATTDATAMLAADKTYYQILIPYNQGLANETRNYYTMGAVAMLSVTTPSVGSDIIAVTASEMPTIGSTVNDPAPLSSTTGAQVWQFTIREGGMSLNDADNLPTIIQQLTLTQNVGNSADVWSEAIQTAALFEGTTLLMSAIITTNSLIFNNLNYTIPDGTTKTLSLRLSLNANLGTNMDGDDVVFNLTKVNVIAAATGSLFANFTTCNSQNGSNLIDVVATRLAFIQQPTQTYQGVAMAPAVILHALDIHGNRDYGFNQSIRLSSSGVLSNGDLQATAVSGLITFSQIIHTNTASNLTLTAKRAATDDFVTNSLSFDIITLPTAVFAQHTAWMTAANWSTGQVPLSVQLAQFSTHTPNTVTIGFSASNNNLGADNQGVGAIELTAAAANGVTIMNGSSTRSGVLTLSGLSLNGENQVILRNNSTKNLTLNNGTTQPMGVVLANTIQNNILVDNSGSILIGAGISGTNRQLTVKGGGTGAVILSGNNTYTGLTTIAGTTLQLNRSGGNTLPETNSVVVNGGILRISTSQTLQNLTLTGGTIWVEAGAILTITGDYMASGGTLNVLGTLKFQNNDSAFPGVGVALTQLAGLDVSMTQTMTLTAAVTVTDILSLNSGKVKLGPHNITLAAAAGLNGGSANSFIVTDGEGKLVRRVTTTSTFFPIGYSPTAYRPATLQMVSGIADYAVQVYPYSAQGTGNRVNLVWRTQRLAQDNTDFNMSFQWSSDDESSPLGHEIYAHRNTSSTGTYAALPYAGSKMGTNPYTTTIYNIPSPSVGGNSDDDALFILSDAATNTVLPVDLLAFTGRSIDKTNILRWETASECKLAHFEVERRASESAHWTVIGFQKARNSASIYTVTDNTPLSIGYYRLKITDLDGTVSYSKVVTVVQAKTSLTYYYDGSQYILQGEVSRPQMLLWSIISLSGQVIEQGKEPLWKGDFRYILPPKTWPKCYVLHIQTQETQLVIKSGW